MIQTYDVRLPTPVQVIAGTGDLLVYNSSTTATVQISDSPGVNSIPLGPGSRISWDAKRPLYLWILSGAAKVLTLDNGGTIDDPAVLAALIVDAGLGQSVADALVASSLASNIGGAVPVPPSAGAIGAAVGTSVPIPPTASAIGTAVGGAVPVPPSAASIGGAVGGAVPVPPSAGAIGAAVPQAGPIASAIQLAGVPAIDIPIMLISTFTTGGIASATVDRYSSLYGYIILEPNVAGIPATQGYVVYLEFGLSGSPIPPVMKRYTFYVCAGSGSPAYIRFAVPSLGTRFSVAAFGIAPNASTIPKMNVYISGSYRNIDRPSFTVSNDDLAMISDGTLTGYDVDIGGFNWQATVAAGQTIQAYPLTRFGKAKLTLTVGNAVNGGDITLYVYSRMSNTQQAYKGYIKAGTVSGLEQPIFEDIIVPRGQMWLQIIGRAGLVGTPLMILNMNYYDND